MAQERRILKEVRSGMSSSLFQFLYDNEGEFWERGAAYVKFTLDSGPFCGQTHLLEFKFNYGRDNHIYRFPQDPPNVLFKTPILHPNISVEGTICLDVIRDKWSPMYGIEAVFSSICLLLGEPNLNSPLNSNAARIYGANPGDQFGPYCQEYYRTKIISGKYNELVKKMNSAPFSRSGQ
jgi:ubiquitin-protein ligase